MPAGPDPLSCAVEVLRKVRSAKTQEKRSLRWGVTRLEVTGSEECRRALEPSLDDVVQAGAVDPDGVQVTDGPSPEGEHFTVHVVRAEQDA